MNNAIFYVYTHATLNGKIFYVGKGCGKRSTSSSQRSNAWKQIAKDGYSVSIVADKLLEEDAYSLEKLIISVFLPFGNLVNVYAGGGPVGQHMIFKGRKISLEHKRKLTEANRNYNQSRYDKSSKTLSVGVWKTPNGDFHSLRLAAESNNCAIMTVRNRCLGFTAKRGDKKYPVNPKIGWSFDGKNDTM
jgi:hypothetical protein